MDSFGFENGCLMTECLHSAENNAKMAESGSKREEGNNFKKVFIFKTKSRIMIEKLFSLKGRTALVTGSSRGLGFSMAKGLAMAGATVILNGRNREKLEKAKEAFRKDYGSVYAYAFDVSSSEQIHESLKKIKKEVGPVDILVNNAGTNVRKDLSEMREDEWDLVIRTNLTSAFLISGKVVKDMIRKKSGKIINTCSMMSEVSRMTTGAYTAAKGGLKMLTKAMTLDWARHNIQINGIGPGYYHTDLTHGLYKDREFNEYIRKRTPAGRWGHPDDLMGTVIFLASDASNYLTGQILYVDGGILASL